MRFSTIIKRNATILLISVCHLTVAAALEIDGSNLLDGSNATEEAMEKNREQERERLRREKAERETKGKFAHLTISSGPNSGYSGKCDGYSDISDHNVKLNNGNHGMLFVKCNNDCWDMTLHSTSFGTILYGATQCGNFDESGWISSGNLFNKFNASITDVGNFILQSN